MEILAKHVSQIKVPSVHDKVYKDECVFSFDNPESDTGLYVSLTSFLGVGKDYLDRYFKKTNNAVFLHIRRIKHEIPLTSDGDGPEKKITRLAIGIEGGFDPSVGRKYEYEDLYNIVVLPSYTTIPWPNNKLPELVIRSVTAILELQSAGKLAELEALSGTWDGESRVISKFANNLLQLDNGKKIPPTGWQCEKCDKVDNLWLNLTDGTILCGRRFYDGTGGNNHAIEHYKTSNYPLAVKLGTITKEGKGDVFSYVEDDMVEDPELSTHLAHWGISIAHMEKTEKSMAELELELNKKSNEWAALSESSGKLKPIYGPGYTGMTNLGNSCFLNSVMQTLFIVPDFINKYYRGALPIFDETSGNPAEDFQVQMAKLGVGLLSGKYSGPPPAGSPVDADPPGISPSMFKTLIGKGHPDFSTKRQQDAQEFLLHVLNLLERHNRCRSNPGDAFKFQVEERVQCNSSKKVKYTHRAENILALNIPLEAAINKDEVSAYESQKAETESQGHKMDPNAVVRPKLKLFSCLEAFMQAEIVEQFYSSALKAKTTARKTTRLSTFPDYLFIQLKKFTLREDWVPIKLDVSVEMPDMLDITNLQGSGPQPDEESLPEIVGSPPPPPSYNEAMLSSLQEMGFPLEACKRALFFTQNSSLEASSVWLMEHITDADFSEPFIPPGTENLQNFIPNTEALPVITGMGFTAQQAVKALEATNNNVARAVDWIFSHADELESGSTPPEPEFRNGDGRYKLVAFISHMGTSTMVGHYVVHILKEGQWIIFNDNKVAISENPPKDLGYLYLYERL